MGTSNTAAFAAHQDRIEEEEAKELGITVDEYRGSRDAAEMEQAAMDFDTVAANYYANAAFGGQEIPALC